MTQRPGAAIPTAPDSTRTPFVPLSLSAAREEPLTGQEVTYDAAFRAWMDTRYVEFPHQIGIETPMAQLLKGAG